jgi:hypothetical protein
MNFTGRDLIKLRLPLLGTLAMLAVVCVLGWWSAGEAGKAAQERDSAASRRNQIEQRLRQARTEEQDLKQRAGIFQALQSTGVAGEEKRLDWTEMLRAIQQELHIPGMTYELGAQIPLENVDGVAYAHFVSPMRLQLRLLHEEDLLNFLNRVEQQAKALVLVRSCKLSRLPPAPGEQSLMAQLNADCELQWITLRRSTGKKQP